MSTRANHGRESKLRRARAAIGMSLCAVLSVLAARSQAANLASLEGARPPSFAAIARRTMAATATPGVETYVNGLNPAGNSTLLISATSGFSNCSLP